MSNSSKTNFAPFQWNPNRAGRKPIPFEFMAPDPRPLTEAEAYNRCVRAEMFASGTTGGDPNLVKGRAAKIDACRDFSPFKNGWGNPRDKNKR